MFENERRKSVGVEEAAARLQKEHNALTNELDALRKQIKQAEIILKDLTSKYSQATAIVEELEAEEEGLKDQAEDIHDKSISHINESKKQEKDLEDLKKIYDKNVVLLREKEKELERLRALIEEKIGENSHFGKEITRLMNAMPISVSRARGQTWGSGGQKSHVVKVLQHESKIFNFEQNVNSFTNSLKRAYR